MRQDRQWNRWIRRIGAACVFCVFGCVLFGQTPAMADAPAVTDFGGDSILAYQTESADAGHRAMFLTLYEDGREELIVRPIMDDAVVSFQSDHAAWQLNHPLMWFLNMPVYVKQIQDTAMAEGI